MITEIEPRYVNHPKSEGGKFGSVVDDASGERYWVPVRMVDQFQVGIKYRIEIQEQTWGDKQVLVVAKQLPRLPENGHGGITTGAAPTKPANGHNGSSQKDETLFVLALAKSAIESNRVTDMNEDALVEVIQTLRRVYRRTFGTP